ncbi:MAG: DUF3784 domain-containing protein [Clostridiales bacterium]|nr:DUF3784 domain-containing protein [Clostridiales bacterium]
MDIWEFVYFLVFGAAVSAVGFAVWKFQKLSLIHSFLYKRVSEADKKTYAEFVGRAIFIIGIGAVLGGITGFFFRQNAGWVIVSVFALIGLVMIAYAQIKYNMGI